jgi:acetolactate synthase small subunit
MKSLILLILTITFSNIATADTAMKKEITDQFSDKIKEVKVIDGNLEVSFSRHAAIYKVSKENPKFKEIKELLEAKKGDSKKLKITSAVPSMVILEISE